MCSLSSHVDQCFFWMVSYNFVTIEKHYQTIWKLVQLISRSMGKKADYHQQTDLVWRRQSLTVSTCLTIAQTSAIGLIQLEFSFRRSAWVFDIKEITFSRGPTSWVIATCPLIFFSEVSVLYDSEGRFLPHLIMEIEKYECSKVVALGILYRVAQRELFLSVVITARILFKNHWRPKKAVQILVFTKMLYVKFLLFKFVSIVSDREKNFLLIDI